MQIPSTEKEKFEEMLKNMDWKYNYEPDPVKRMELAEAAHMGIVEKEKLIRKYPSSMYEILTLWSRYTM